MDEGIKSTLETITNSKLQYDQWILSSLPIRCGGLGVRRVQDLALPAFLSSVHGLSSMVGIMLNLPAFAVEDIANHTDAINAWQFTNPGTNQPERPQSQKQWDSIQINRLSNELQFDQEEDVARIMASQKPESGAWLHALPSRNIGTLVENNAFRIMVGLRLGIDLCAPHTCVCGATVDTKGRHGLKCKKSAGRWSRHAELNNIIKRALATADIPTRLEPPGIFREDGKRVDGISLIPWFKGQTLVWDATCTDTYAPSNLRYSTKSAGRAAEDKAKRKETKYRSLVERNYHFVPFAVETMGPWCMEAIKFFDEMGKMIATKTDEPRSKSFLKQRISMAIQKGNAAAVMGCFEPSEHLEEVFYL